VTVTPFSAELTFESVPEKAMEESSEPSPELKERLAMVGSVMSVPLLLVSVMRSGEEPTSTSLTERVSDLGTSSVAVCEGEDTTFAGGSLMGATVMSTMSKSTSPFTSALFIWSVAGPA
jgi:hypothetical protein